MNTVTLAGCRPDPLGSYLKALGVTRLVSAQFDPSVTGWWEGETFRLKGRLDADSLVSSFLVSYRPTPVLSPWNNDAGFKEGTSRATARLRAMESTDDPRFEPFRSSIAVVREVRSDPRWVAADKADQVAIMRNRLPDEALDWIDAAIVLRSGKPAFPALLGAGGNFGRLELSPTFIARVLQVLDPTPAAVERSRGWLRAALFDEGSPPLLDDPVGQFDPGAAGGLRATQAGAGQPITNPWDFVLVIEGALLWASGVARRLGSAASVAAVPFTVAPSSVGHASLAAGERAKAELWAPLWADPLGLVALRRLFAEGRISWSHGMARSGLDAVRAMRNLGTDAGIGAFVRYVVADRMGQSPLAVPIGRFDVHTEVDPGVAVLASIDEWQARLRRITGAQSAPASISRAAQRVEQSVFVAAAGGPAALQEVLIAVAGADAAVGRTEQARSEGLVPPVRPLPAGDWCAAMDDDSIELRLAVTLAVALDPDVVDARFGTIRSLLRPVEPVSRGSDRFTGVEWTREEAPVRGFGIRPIADVLADALVARSEADRLWSAGADRRNGETEPWFASALPTLTGDTEAFAGALIDDQHLGELLAGVLLLDPRPRRAAHQWRHERSAVTRPVVPAWRILAPFFARHPVPTLGGPVVLRPRSTWARRLVAGEVDGVLADALLRWEQAGFRTVYDRRRVEALAAGADGRRLAASLLCGATRTDVAWAAETIARPRTDEPSEGVLT